jgi:hypothetical protein
MTTNVASFEAPSRIAAQDAAFADAVTRTRAPASAAM